MSKTEPQPSQKRYSPPECGCDEGKAECGYKNWPEPFVHVIYTDKGDLFVMQKHEGGWHEVQAFLKPAVEEIKKALGVKP